MDNPEVSGQPQNNSTHRSPDDIPEALRDLASAEPQARNKLVYLIGGLVALGAIAGASLWYITSSSPTKNVVSESAPAVSPTPLNAQVAKNVNPSTKDLDTLLGHFAYVEAPVQELQPIVANGSIKLRQAAAQKFIAMARSARASGIILVPISGFRSVQEQQHVFFEIKAQRGQTAVKRAEVSAPPGYSEHHTGYAVDIGDGTVPATNLNPKFEQTKAFKWLAANAASFSFEMSFPKNNTQGVSYEPWHWRFVGDRHSLETFYKAKNSSFGKTP